MHVFYVLFEGVTWEIASKLATGTKKYKSTIHRRVQKWIKNGIFEISYNEIVKMYIKENDISELFIDSTDIGNKNMTTKNTYKSFKLKKQALRLTLIGDSNRAPIDYAIDKAHKPDCELGYHFLKNSKLDNKKIITIYGDKGYQMNEQKRKMKRKIKRKRKW